MGYHKNLRGADLHEPSWQQVINLSGAAINSLKGAYLYEWSTSIPTIIEAANGIRCDGIVYGNIANGAEGVIVTHGIIRNIDTSAWFATQRLFVDNNGDLQGEVTDGIYKGKVKAIVLSSNALTGSIWVLPSEIEVESAITVPEETFTIVNNQSVAADVTGLTFPDSELKGVRGGFIEYTIYRRTDTSEHMEVGTMMIRFQGSTNTWYSDIVRNSSGDAGVTFTILTGGQIQYTSSNITGATAVSEMTFRAKTIS